MFPLQFTGTLGRFNLECTVSGGGRSSQAGAVRLAISRALRSFLSEGEGEAMRQGGSSYNVVFLFYCLSPAATARPKTTTKLKK